MKYKNNCVKVNNLFLVAIVLLFVIISAKLIYVAVSTNVDGINIKEFALSRTTAKKTITANRGTIFDISGEILAQDVRSYTVIAYLAESRTTDKDHPQHVVDKQATAEALSPIINMKVESILKLLNRSAYQVELGPGGRGITELVKQQIDALDLPGIDFIKSSKRNYPYEDFASYIIGYAKKGDDTDEKVKGEMGIELKYDAELKGTDGSITYQKDAYGYKIANTPEISTKSEDGMEIYLTLDSNVQMYLEHAMDQIKEIGIDWSTITIADAKTGAIVGSASTPSFNPNKLNITNWNSPLTSYTYEPGSTMKIYSFMAAMEEGKYNGDEKYSSGTIKVDAFTIKDWNNIGWGQISFNTGFTYSSNVAAVKLGQKLGNDILTDYYHKFGFGSATGIELPNEYTGKLDIVYDSELANAAFGQGLTTTPIQNIQALTSITNKGIILKPYIISKIINPSTGEVVYEGKRTEVRRAVSENTVNQIIELMDQTVNGEDPVVTGKKYHTEAIRLIGKTGTAQYATASGRYSSGGFKNIRSFAGIFPKDNPEYIIYFSVKDFLGASSEMGSIIKSVVESIAKYKNLDQRESDEDKSKMVNIGNYLNITPNDATSKLQSSLLNPIIIGDGNTIIKQYPAKGTTVLAGSKVFLLTNGINYVMPNVVGWSSSEVISFANMIKLKYTTEGYGNVVSTNITEGSPIDVNGTIEIKLGG